MEIGQVDAAFAVWEVVVPNAMLVPTMNAFGTLQVHAADWFAQDARSKATSLTERIIVNNRFYLGRNSHSLENYERMLFWYSIFLERC